MSRTATVVASEPVPDVVGIARCGLSGAGGCLALADGRIDVVHHRRRMRGDEIGDLRRVHARAAADGHEPVDLVLERVIRRGLERVDRRLDPAVVIDDDLDSLPLDQALDPLGVPERRDAGIGDEHRPTHAEALQLPARVG